MELSRVPGKTYPSALNRIRTGQISTHHSSPTHGGWLYVSRNEFLGGFIPPSTVSLRTQPFLKILYEHVSEVVYGKLFFFFFVGK